MTHTHVLRDDTGPACSQLLTHLCSREGGTSAESDSGIAALDPPARLARILSTGQMRGFVPYTGGVPAVCFSESPPEHLTYLITERGLAPWGLLICRDWLFQMGGGPVWHVRSDTWSEVEQLTPRARTFAIRFGPATAGRSGSEWLHQREWRVPLNNEPPTLHIPEDAIGGVVIGNDDWCPGKQGERCPDWWGQKPIHLFQNGMEYTGTYTLEGHD